MEAYHHSELKPDDAPFASLPEVRKVNGFVKDGDPLAWEDAWKAKVTPWDSGELQPPLREVIESGEVPFPRQGRALVPGCGSGYDVAFIATALGLKTIGMDISETALAKAKAISPTNVPPPGEVSWELADFFKLKYPAEDKFDLVYDYTFFVAIPPVRRPEWGKQVAAITKPGGYLIALVWPIDPPSDFGPPYFVRVEHYEEVLGKEFVKVVDKVPGKSLPKHAGKERIVVWKKV
ncbi:hypothetical protein C0992_010683 [Termitomyces sp. T32_za158]|nr:hypothetical protein C0992_010683 [Termitomyces sp. T32_za158]